MRDRFRAEHALKSPAHITLQMPFRRKSAEEPVIIETIQKVAAAHNQFEVAMDGFDCFLPRVIFIRVSDHESIIRLHKNLSFELDRNLELSPKELTTKVHPHMTVATRDLSEEAFKRAWPEFQKRDFKASFQAKNLCLLKHNGAYWEVYKVFPFNSK